VTIAGFRRNSAVTLQSVGQTGAVRPADIVRRFPGDDYLGFHSRRYALVLELLEHFAPDARAVLDVGPSQLTTLVAEQYGKPVDSVGREDVGANTTGGTHYDFDLDRLPDDRGPAALGRYDAILCCEVLEHLHVAPEHLLAWLREHLHDDGMLVVQTPNAAALDRRVKLLRGRQPYDALDPERSGARHVRECTYAELRDFAATAGFDIVRSTRHAYFDYRFAPGGGGTARRVRHVAQNALDRSMPRSLRSGITLVLSPAK
jgi:hypothetical protein